MAEKGLSEDEGERATRETGRGRALTSITTEEGRDGVGDEKKPGGPWLSFYKVASVIAGG